MTPRITNLYKSRVKRNDIINDVLIINTYLHKLSTSVIFSELFHYCNINASVFSNPKNIDFKNQYSKLINAIIRDKNLYDQLMLLIKQFNKSVNNFIKIIEV